MMKQQTMTQPDNDQMQQTSFDQPQTAPIYHFMPAVPAFG